MSAKNEWGLTPQQEKFAQAVVSGKSLSDAYRASYKVGKSKPETVNENASRVMSDAKVSARVRFLAEKVEEEFAIDTAKLLKESSRIAFSDVSRIMHPDGKVKLPNELDPDTRAAVASFKIDEYGRIEYKFWDKNSSHERLFKHKALFEKHNNQITDPLVDVLKALGGNVLGTGNDNDEDE